MTTGAMSVISGSVECFKWDERVVLLSGCDNFTVSSFRGNFCRISIVERKQKNDTINSLGWEKGFVEFKLSKNELKWTNNLFNNISQIKLN